MVSKLCSTDRTQVQVPGAARQMGNPLNEYLAPVHLAASRYLRGITRGIVASLSRGPCIVCDVVSALPEDRSMSSELAP